MLIYEGLFYALGSSIAALILSILMNPLIGRMLESMFWFFSANFTILPVLFTVPIFALLGWLIPSVMYGQVARQSVVERLREAVKCTPCQGQHGLFIWNSEKQRDIL